MDKDENYTHYIHKKEEEQLNRRHFMKMMIGTTGAFALATLPFGGASIKRMLGQEEEVGIEIATIDELQIGESKVFTYPNEESALLIRLSETTYKAYQNACTHLKCPVFWEKQEKVLLCPCHHGKFNVQTGDPIAGPPIRPLPEIELKIKGKAIMATGIKI